MAQFVPFDANVEVAGQAVTSFIEAIPIGREARMEILKKHGVDPISNDWVSQEATLKAYREVAETLGENTLFMIGKAIPDLAEFPPEVDNLEKAFRSLDMAYHMNHRGGEIGNYNLTHFDEQGRTATMVCHNPYPTSMDRGIITALLRKFKPRGSFRENVELDPNQESRSNGQESCTYKISW